MQFGVILPLLLVIGITESRITHNFAEIIDQDDLNNPTNMVLLLKCKRGCYLYGSISRNFEFSTAKNITIVNVDTDDTVTTLFDLATAHTGDHGKKVAKPLYDGLYSINKKEGMDLKISGFVIYVVSRIYFNTENDGLTPVYEASRYDLNTPYDQNIFTLMSADPFTLRQVVTASGDQLSIYAAGYDVIMSDKPDPCVPIYQGSDANNLAHIELPTPLVTLSFSSSQHFNITVDSNIDGATVLADGQKTAIISPGYHGCTDPQRFRYPNWQGHTFTHELRTVNDRLLTFILAHLNVYINDAVQLTDSLSRSYIYGYSGHDQDQTRQISDNYLKITWYDINRNGTFGFQVSVSKDQPATDSTIASATVSTSNSTSTNTPPTTSASNGHVETTSKAAPEYLVMTLLAMITTRALL